MHKDELRDTEKCKLFQSRGGFPTFTDAAAHYFTTKGEGYLKHNKTFVLSDIHGEYEKFEELMKHWNSETMNLAILGDMIDRGENSLKGFKR